jgi:hypothetical protein
VTQLVVDRKLDLVFGRVHVEVALSADELGEPSPPGALAPQATAAPAAERPQVVGIKEPPARPPPPRPRRSERGEAPAATISRNPGSGRRGIVCPHCWHRFDVEEFLFIARHQSLVGDPVLGADARAAAGSGDQGAAGEAESAPPAPQ